MIMNTSNLSLETDTDNRKTGQQGEKNRKRGVGTIWEDKLYNILCIFVLMHYPPIIPLIDA